MTSFVIINEVLYYHYKISTYLFHTHRVILQSYIYRLTL